jgi:hypothetical protein
MSRMEKRNARSFQFWVIHMANRLVSGSRDNPIELTMKQDGKPGIRRRYKGRRLQGSKHAIRADVEYVHYYVQANRACADLHSLNLQYTGWLPFTMDQAIRR